METDESALGTLPLRELCYEFERVLRTVAGGQSFVLINDGIPVAKVVPLKQEPSLPITRPARRMGGWARLGIDRKMQGESVSAALENLRRDRF